MRSFVFIVDQRGLTPHHRLHCPQPYLQETRYLWYLDPGDGAVQGPLFPQADFQGGVVSFLLHLSGAPDVRFLLGEILKATLR